MSRQKDRKLNYAQHNGAVANKKVTKLVRLMASINLFKFHFRSFRITIASLAEPANDRSDEQAKHRSVFVDAPRSDHRADEVGPATGQQPDECARAKGKRRAASVHFSLKTSVVRSLTNRCFVPNSITSPSSSSSQFSMCLHLIENRLIIQIHLQLAERKKTN